MAEKTEKKKEKVGHEKEREKTRKIALLRQ